MKCSIRLKSFNHRILENITNLCLKEEKKINLEKISVTRLPKKIKKFSLIRSPHVHKKSREQFEIINYSRLISLKGPKESLDKLIDKTIVNNKHTFYYKVCWHK